MSGTKAPVRDSSQADLIGPGENVPLSNPAAKANLKARRSVSNGLDTPPAEKRWMAAVSVLRRRLDSRHEIAGILVAGSAGRVSRVNHVPTRVDLHGGTAGIAVGR